MIGGDVIATMREYFSQASSLLKMSLVALGTCISAVSMSLYHLALRYEQSEINTSCNLNAVVDVSPNLSIRY
ncbi:hypothetical protein [Photobacterium damselae]